jgi:uncharacterized protein (TIGR03435 family)
MVAKLFLLTVGFPPLTQAQTFEVASIRASQFQSADGEGGQAESINVSGDRLTMRNVTLRSCISWAYNIQDFQVAGELGVNRFDITAKAAAPAAIPLSAIPLPTIQSMREMMRALLADRFKFTFHRDTRQLASLALIVSKGGPKVQISQQDGPGILRPTRSAMVAQHATMAEFVKTLSGPLRTPVVDETGLTGRYDFTVDLSSYFADTRQGDQPDITGIVMSALRDQLGLKLESRKEPVEILVIDHVEKNPTGN